MNFVNGMRLIENPMMVDRVQIRFPRSKRRRIQKKWQKRETNFEIKPSKEIIHFRPNNSIIAHPEAIRQILASVPSNSYYPYRR